MVCQFDRPASGRGSKNEAFRNDTEAIMKSTGKTQVRSNAEARMKPIRTTRKLSAEQRKRDNKAYQNKVESIMKPTVSLSAITCTWDVSLEKLSPQRLIHYRQCKGGLSLPYQSKMSVWCAAICERQSHTMRTLSGRRPSITVTN